MSSDASNPLKKLKPHANAPRRFEVDPNETAYEALKDAENIRRDVQRREQRRELQSYTGEDEDTKRTDVHVHVHQHSQPDVEVETSVEVGPLKAKGIPRWAMGVIGVTAALIAAGTALLAHLLAK